jgi:hypothetical protein
MNQQSAGASALGLLKSSLSQIKKVLKPTKAFVAASAFGLGSLGVASQATAMPIFLGLGLDASGSISTSEFELQRNGYISVLEDLAPQLVANEVWISINQFSSSVRNELGLTQVTVAATQDGGVIKTALQNLSKLGGGTNIGISIDDLVSEYQIQPDDFFGKAVIDISTDGQGSLGSSVTGALAAGIDQINCLGVGSGANCGFLAGTDAFSITVAGFDDFEQALRTKIGREVGVSDVLEPSTMALFGLGLAGLTVVRRRRQA